MRPSSCVKDLTWSSLFGVLMLSMVLGLSACSSVSSDSNDNFSPVGGVGGDGVVGGGGLDGVVVGCPLSLIHF